MQILLAPAKDMTADCSLIPSLQSKPAFQQQANDFAVQLAAYNTEELMAMLHCNRQLAAENVLRYQSFFDNSHLRQAVLSYTGIAYKRLDASSFSDDDFEFLQNHLFIASFLYGLLRPMDMINCYRLEGNVELPCNDGDMFSFWRPLLTDFLIKAVKSDDGILLNLASQEMKLLFDWKRVCQEIRVIDIDFPMNKNGKMKNMSIYCKMNRGNMTRYIVKNRLSQIEQLTDYSYEGFSFTPDLCKGNNHLVFALL